MTDAEFLATLESGTLPETDFNHHGHVRAASEGATSRVGGATLLGPCWMILIAAASVWASA